MGGRKIIHRLTGRRTEDPGHQREAGSFPHNGICLIENPTEYRVRVIEIPAHLVVLRSLAGKNEHDARSGGCAHAAILRRAAVLMRPVRTLMTFGPQSTPDNDLHCGCCDDDIAMQTDEDRASRGRFSNRATGARRDRRTMEMASLFMRGRGSSENVDGGK